MPKVGAAAGFTDDLQLALYLCYELNYTDVPELAGISEWDPDLVRFRQRLEAAFEHALREAAAPVRGSRSLREDIRRLIADDDGPSVSTHMESVGTRAEMIDFVKHRSLYQLKEADPHTFAIPHLRGRAKQILAEIQSGEYGADAPHRRMHSTLFAETMTSLGLDARPNAYLDELPGTAMMIPNLISLFGLNRTHRGSLVGHLAVFEMTSVIPMGRYSRGLARMSAPTTARRFYDVHVLADAEHEHMALDMAIALERDEPQLHDDIIFGVRCVLLTERMFAERLFAEWAHRRRMSIQPAA
ncbi:MAG: hypothetical protein JWN62_3172 [Acidimicrobiales bacterium]|nr:hypothetical protein [Acidimicrobiales bacterium]